MFIHSTRISCVVLTLLLGGQYAEGGNLVDEEGGTLVLEPVAQFNIPTRYTKRVARSLKKGAEQEIATTEVHDRAVANTYECAGDVSCLAEIGEKFGAGKVVGVTLRRTSQNRFSITFVLARTDGSEVARKTYKVSRRELKNRPGQQLQEFLADTVRTNAVSLPESSITQQGETALQVPTVQVRPSGAEHSLTPNLQPAEISLQRNSEGEPEDVKFGIDLSLVSTYYFRGVVVSHAPHQAAVQPSLTMDFKSGFSASVWGSMITSDRKSNGRHNKNADEIDFGLAYSAANKWASVTLGYTQYVYPSTDPLASTGELSFGLSAVSLTALTPSVTNYVSTGGRLGDEAAPMYWYIEAGLANSQELGEGTLETGLVLGFESLGGAPKASDLRLAMSLSYPVSGGLTVTPGISFGLTLDEDKYQVDSTGRELRNVAWGSLSAAY